MDQTTSDSVQASPLHDAEPSAVSPLAERIAGSQNIPSDMHDAASQYRMRHALHRWKLQRTLDLQRADVSAQIAICFTR